MSVLRVASPLTFDSIVDGEGLRAVLWLQGCVHQCLHCHNPQTHDITKGTEMETDTLFAQFMANPLQCGITISGGEPFLQSAALLPLTRQVQQAGKSIWIYSGYTLEELLAHPMQQAFTELLACCDVLVDGRYRHALRNPLLPFRGSENQRIINLAQTSKEKQLILWKAHSM